MEQFGFFEVDTVDQCRSTGRGDCVSTLNLTGMHTGWVHTLTTRTNARTHIRHAVNHALEVTGIVFDSGSECIDQDMATWAAERAVNVTRSRTCQKKTKRLWCANGTSVDVTTPPHIARPATRQ